MQVNKDIDQRLIDRGTKFIDASVAPGVTVWKVVKAQFFPVGDGPGKAGGRTNAFVEAVDENGNQLKGIEFKFSWPTGSAPIVTNGRTGFDAANQPFSKGRNAFTISKEDGDTVQGIGMGQDDPGGWNAGEHTSTLLRYQRMIEEGSSTGETPVDPPPTNPAKTVVETLVLYSDMTYERANG